MKTSNSPRAEVRGDGPDRKLGGRTVFTELRMFLRALREALVASLLAFWELASRLWILLRFTVGSVLFFGLPAALLVGAMWFVITDWFQTLGRPVEFVADLLRMGRNLGIVFGASLLSIVYAHVAGLLLQKPFVQRLFAWPGSEENEYSWSNIEKLRKQRRFSESDRRLFEALYEFDRRIFSEIFREGSPLKAKFDRLELGSKQLVKFWTDGKLAEGGSLERIRRELDDEVLPRLEALERLSAFMPSQGAEFIFEGKLGNLWRVVYSNYSMEVGTAHDMKESIVEKDSVQMRIFPSALPILYLNLLMHLRRRLVDADTAVSLTVQGELGRDILFLLAPLLFGKGLVPDVNYALHSPTGITIGDAYQSYIGQTIERRLGTKFGNETQTYFALSNYSWIPFALERLREGKEREEIEVLSEGLPTAEQLLTDAFRFQLEWAAYGSMGAKTRYRYPGSLGRAYLSIREEFYRYYASLRDEAGNPLFSGEELENFVGNRQVVDSQGRTPHRLKKEVRPILEKLRRHFAESMDSLLEFQSLAEKGLARLREAFYEAHPELKAPLEQVFFAGPEFLEFAFPSFPRAEVRLATGRAGSERAFDVREVMRELSSQLKLGRAPLVGQEYVALSRKIEKGLTREARSLLEADLTRVPGTSALGILLGLALYFLEDPTRLEGTLAEFEELVELYNQAVGNQNWNRPEEAEFSLGEPYLSLPLLWLLSLSYYYATRESQEAYVRFSRNLLDLPEKYRAWVVALNLLFTGFHFTQQQDRADVEAILPHVKFALEVLREGKADTDIERVLKVGLVRFLIGAEPSLNPKFRDFDEKERFMQLRALVRECGNQIISLAQEIETLDQTHQVTLAKFWWGLFHGAFGHTPLWKDSEAKPLPLDRVLLDPYRVEHKPLVRQFFEAARIPRGRDPAVNPVELPDFSSHILYVKLLISVQNLQDQPFTSRAEVRSEAGGGSARTVGKLRSVSEITGLISELSERRKQLVSREMDSRIGTLSAPLGIEPRGTPPASIYEEVDFLDRLIVRLWFHLVGRSEMNRLYRRTMGSWESKVYLQKILDSGRLRELSSLEKNFLSRYAREASINVTNIWGETLEERTTSLVGRLNERIDFDEQEPNRLLQDELHWGESSVLRSFRKSIEYRLGDFTDLLKREVNVSFGGEGLENLLDSIELAPEIRFATKSEIEALTQAAHAFFEAYDDYFIEDQVGVDDLQRALDKLKSSLRFSFPEAPQKIKDLLEQIKELIKDLEADLWIWERFAASGARPDTRDGPQDPSQSGSSRAEVRPLLRRSGRGKKPAGLQWRAEVRADLTTVLVGASAVAAVGLGIGYWLWKRRSKDSGIPREKILSYLKEGNEKRLERVAREINQAFYKRAALGEPALLEKYLLFLRQGKMTTGDLMKLGRHGLEERHEAKLLRELWGGRMDDFMAEKEAVDALVQFRHFLETLPHEAILQFSEFLSWYLYAHFTKIHPELADPWPAHFRNRESAIAVYRNFLSSFPEEIAAFEARLASDHYHAKERAKAHAELHASLAELVGSENVIDATELEESEKTDYLNFRNLIEARKYKKAVRFFNTLSISRNSVFYSYLRASGQEGYGYERAVKQLRSLRRAGLSTTYYREGISGLIYSNFHEMFYQGYLERLAREGLDERIMILALLTRMMFRKWRKPRNVVTSRPDLENPRKRQAILYRLAKKTLDPEFKPLRPLVLLLQSYENPFPFRRAEVRAEEDESDWGTGTPVSFEEIAEKVNRLIREGLAKEFKGGRGVLIFLYYGQRYAAGDPFARFDVLNGRVAGLLADEPGAVAKENIRLLSDVDQGTNYRVYWRGQSIVFEEVKRPEATPPSRAEVRSGKVAEEKTLRLSRETTRDRELGRRRRTSGRASFDGRPSKRRPLQSPGQLERWPSSQSSSSSPFSDSGTLAGEITQDTEKINRRTPPEASLTPAGSSSENQKAIDDEPTSNAKALNNALAPELRRWDSNIAESRIRRSPPVVKIKLHNMNAILANSHKGEKVTFRRAEVRLVKAPLAPTRRTESPVGRGIKKQGGLYRAEVRKEEKINGENASAFGRANQGKEGSRRLQRIGRKPRKPSKTPSASSSSPLRLHQKHQRVERTYENTASEKNWQEEFRRSQDTPGDQRSEARHNQPDQDPSGIFSPLGSKSKHPVAPFARLKDITGINYSQEIINNYEIYEFVSRRAEVRSEIEAFINSIPGLRELLDRVREKFLQFAEKATSPEEKLDTVRAFTRIFFPFLAGVFLAHDYRDLFGRYLTEFVEPLWSFGEDVRILNYLLASQFGFHLNDFAKKAQLKHPREDVEKAFASLLQGKSEWPRARQFYYLPGLPIVVEDTGLSSEARAKLETMARQMTESGWFKPEAWPESLSYVQSVIPVEDPEYPAGGEANYFGHPKIKVTMYSPDWLGAALNHEGQHYVIWKHPRWEKILEFEQRHSIPELRHSWYSEGQGSASTLLSELETYALQDRYRIHLSDRLNFDSLGDLVWDLPKSIAKARTAIDLLQTLPGYLNAEGNEEAKAWFEASVKQWDKIEAKVKELDRKLLKMRLDSEDPFTRQRGYLRLGSRWKSAESEPDKSEIARLFAEAVSQEKDQILLWTVAVTEQIPEELRRLAEVAPLFKVSHEESGQVGEKLAPLSAEEALAFLKERMKYGLLHLRDGDFQLAYLTARDLKPGARSIHLAAGYSPLPLAEALMGLEVQAVSSLPTQTTHYPIVARINTNAVTKTDIGENIKRHGGSFRHLGEPTEESDLAGQALFDHVNAIGLFSDYPWRHENPQQAIQQVVDLVRPGGNILINGNWKKVGLMKLANGAALLRKEFKRRGIRFREAIVSREASLYFSETDIRVFTVESPSPSRAEARAGDREEEERVQTLIAEISAGLRPSDRELRAITLSFNHLRNEIKAALQATDVETVLEMLETGKVRVYAAPSLDQADMGYIRFSTQEDVTKRWRMVKQWQVSRQSHVELLPLLRLRVRLKNLLKKRNPELRENFGRVLVWIWKYGRVNQSEEARFHVEERARGESSSVPTRRAEVRSRALEFKPSRTVGAVHDKLGAVQQTGPTQDQGDVIGLGQHRVDGEGLGSLLRIQNAAPDSSQQGTDPRLLARGDALQRRFKEELRDERLPEKSGNNRVGSPRINNRQMGLAPAPRLAELNLPPDSIKVKTPTGKGSLEVRDAPNLKVNRHRRDRRESPIRRKDEGGGSLSGPLFPRGPLFEGPPQGSSDSKRQPTDSGIFSQSSGSGQKPNRSPAGWPSGRDFSSSTSSSASPERNIDGRLTPVKPRPRAEVREKDEARLKEAWQRVGSTKAWIEKKYLGSAAGKTPVFGQVLDGAERYARGLIEGRQNPFMAPSQLEGIRKMFVWRFIGRWFLSSVAFYSLFAFYSLDGRLSDVLWPLLLRLYLLYFGLLSGGLAIPLVNQINDAIRKSTRPLPSVLGDKKILGDLLYRYENIRRGYGATKYSSAFGKVWDFLYGLVRRASRRLAPHDPYELVPFFIIFWLVVFVPFYFVWFWLPFLPPETIWGFLIPAFYVIPVLLGLIHLGSLAHAELGKGTKEFFSSLTSRSFWAGVLLLAIYQWLLAAPYVGFMGVTIFFIWSGALNYSASFFKEFQLEITKEGRLLTELEEERDVGRLRAVIEEVVQLARELESSTPPHEKPNPEKIAEFSAFLGHVLFNRHLFRAEVRSERKVSLLPLGSSLASRRAEVWSEKEPQEFEFNSEINLQRRLEVLKKFWLFSHNFLGYLGSEIERLGDVTQALDSLKHYELAKESYAELSEWGRKYQALSYYLYGEVLSEEELIQRLNQKKDVDLYFLRNADTAFLLIQELGLRRKQKGVLYFSELFQSFEQTQQRDREIAKKILGRLTKRPLKMESIEGDYFDIDKILLTRALNMVLGLIPSRAEARRTSVPLSQVQRAEVRREGNWRKQSRRNQLAKRVNEPVFFDGQPNRRPRSSGRARLGTSTQFQPFSLLSFRGALGGLKSHADPKISTTATKTATFRPKRRDTRRVDRKRAPQRISAIRKSDFATKSRRYGSSITRQILQRRLLDVNNNLQINNALRTYQFPPRAEVRPLLRRSGRGKKPAGLQWRAEVRAVASIVSDPAILARVKQAFESWVVEPARRGGIDTTDVNGQFEKWPPFVGAQVIDGILYLPFEWGPNAPPSSKETDWGVLRVYEKRNPYTALLKGTRHRFLSEPYQTIEADDPVIDVTNYSSLAYRAHTVKNRGRDPWEVLLEWQQSFQFVDLGELVVDLGELAEKKVQELMSHPWLWLRYGPVDQLFAQRINVREAFHDLFAQFFQKYVKPEDQLLDIGAGMGGVYRLKPRWFPKENWYQVDSDSSLIDFLSGRGWAIRPALVRRWLRWWLGSRFIQADAHRLPFADQAFDVALGFASYDVFQDLDRAVSETSRVLRPGGKFIHLIDTLPNERVLKGKAGFDFLMKRGHRVFERRLVRALKRNGFQIVEAGDWKGTSRGRRTLRHRLIARTRHLKLQVPDPDRINKISLHYNAGWVPEVTYAEEGERPNRQIEEEVTVRVVVAEKSRAEVRASKSDGGDVRSNRRVYLEALREPSIEADRLRHALAESLASLAEDPSQALRMLESLNIFEGSRLGEDLQRREFALLQVEIVVVFLEGLALRFLDLEGKVYGETLPRDRGFRYSRLVSLLIEDLREGEKEAALRLLGNLGEIIKYEERQIDLSELGARERRKQSRRRSPFKEILDEAVSRVRRPYETYRQEAEPLVEPLTRLAPAIESLPEPLPIHPKVAEREGTEKQELWEGAQVVIRRIAQSASEFALNREMKEFPPETRSDWKIWDRASLEDLLDATLLSLHAGIVFSITSRLRQQLEEINSTSISAWALFLGHLDGQFQKLPEDAHWVKAIFLWAVYGFLRELGEQEREDFFLVSEPWKRAVIVEKDPEHYRRLAEAEMQRARAAEGLGEEGLSRAEVRSPLDESKRHSIEILVVGEEMASESLKTFLKMQGYASRNVRGAGGFKEATRILRQGFRPHGLFVSRATMTEAMIEDYEEFKTELNRAAEFRDPVSAILENYLQAGSLERIVEELESRIAGKFTEFARAEMRGGGLAQFKPTLDSRREMRLKRSGTATRIASSTKINRSSMPVSRPSTRSLQSKSPRTSSAITEMPFRKLSMSVPTSVGEYPLSSRDSSGIVGRPQLKGAATLPKADSGVNIKNNIISYSQSTLPETVREILADTRVQAEVKRLSGEGIRPETAFELGRVVGVFHPKYSQPVLLAMLRALRVTEIHLAQEQIPLYLRNIVKEFRARGIPLPVRKGEAGAEILLYDHLPTRAQTAAILFSLATNPGTPAELIIFSKQEWDTAEKRAFERYQQRLKKVLDTEGRALQLEFFQTEDGQELKRYLEKETLPRLSRHLAPRVAKHFRRHIVVTLEEDLAKRLEREEPTVFYPLHGTKQVRYGTPEASYQYSILQSAAVRLSETDYEALEALYRRALKPRSELYFESNYPAIDEADWSRLWLTAQTQLLETLAQAA